MNSAINYFIFFLVICFVITYVKIFLIGLLCLVALVILIAIISGISFKIKNKKVAKFRKENSGQYILWYGSRKKMKRRIKQSLKPLLPEDLIVICSSRKNTKSDLPVHVLNSICYTQNRVKFPRLIKVEESGFITISLYPEMHALLYERLDKALFDKKISERLNAKNKTLPTL